MIRQLGVGEPLLPSPNGVSLCGLGVLPVCQHRGLVTAGSEGSHHTLILVLCGGERIIATSFRDIQRSNNKMQYHLYLDLMVYFAAEVISLI